MSLITSIFSHSRSITLWPSNGLKWFFEPMGKKVVNKQKVELNASFNLKRKDSTI